MNSISPQMLGLVVGDMTLAKTPGSGGGGPARAATLKRLLRMAVRRRWILIGGVVAGGRSRRPVHLADASPIRRDRAAADLA